MDCAVKFVILLSHNIFIFKHKITGGLNDHMAAAICMEAFDVVIPRLPVNRCLDRKGSLVKAFKVVLFFFNNFAQGRAEKISSFL